MNRAYGGPFAVMFIAALDRLDPAIIVVSAAIICAIVVAVIVFRTRSSGRRHGKLALSGRQLRLIFDCMTDGAIAVDTQSEKFLYANKAICTATGYTPPQIVALSITSIIPAPDAPRITSMLADRHNGDAMFIADIPVLCKDGNIIRSGIDTIPAHIRGRACLMCIFHDIAGRSRSENREQAHHEAEQRFSDRLTLLSQVTNELAKTNTLDGMYRRVVELGMTHLGIDRLSLWLVPEDRSSMNGTYGVDISGNITDEHHAHYPINPNTRIWPVICGDTPFQMYVDVPLYSCGELVGNGSRVTAGLWDGEKVVGYISMDNLIRHKPFSDQDCQILKLFAFSVGHLYSLKRVQDELRESEGRFSLFMQNLPGFAFLKDHERRFLFVSRLMEDALAISPDDWFGRTSEEIWPDLWGQKTLDTMRRNDEEVLTSGKTSAIEENLLTHGGTRTYHTIRFPVPHPNQPLWLGGIAIDITELKHMERESEKLQEQLIQAQKMESVGRLAGGVAHDFNNMLSVIIGLAELAVTRLDANDQLCSDLQEILRAARRSAGLTAQLLAFARKQVARPKELNLNDAITGTVQMLNRLLREDISLVIMPDHRLWPVLIDPVQFDQVLANLAVNARDSIEGVGHIMIKTANAVFDDKTSRKFDGSTPGDYVMISVSDDGCGMSEEIRTHLFEPFFTTKESGKGTGLGLATVYGIVRQNNGVIGVESEPGKGTTVKIYLPRHMGIKSAGDEKPAPSAPAKGSETILLVEDEPMVLAVNETFLRKSGYAVLSANSPIDALQIAVERGAGIDMLVTDVIMPGMNGRDLAEQLRAMFPRIKCLFISGYAADIITRGNLIDEHVNFLQKPYSMKDLAAKIREVIDGKHTHSAR